MFVTYFFIIIKKGFDIPKERMKILACVQHAIASTPHFDPIGRTEYFNRRAKEETVKFMKKQNHTISGGGSPSEPVSSDDGIACLMEAILFVMYGDWMLTNELKT